MARKKADQQPETTPGPGHNAEITEEQKQVRFFQLVEQYKSAQAELSAAREDVNCIKRAIKDAGFLMEQVTDAIQLETEDGEESFKHMIERKLKIAKWMGMEIGLQGELFGGRDPDRAFNEGKRAGMKAEACKPPYAPNTADYTDWMKGYDEGQTANMNFKKLEGPRLVKPDTSAIDDDALAEEPTLN